MNTKVYQKPTTNIVQLQHQTHLLQASVQDNQVGMRNYSKEEYYEE